MTVVVYRSTDASAPVLSGTVGTLLTVLDAVLVNGYGAKSAAGWTKPFVNSGNIGCYQNSAVDGTGFCLAVNDNGPGTGAAREARINGFQTMSALATGTGQFPTAGQINIGTGNLVLRKSTTADSTARAWTIIADDTVFYFFIETGDQVSPTATTCVIFGDIFSYKTNDAYRCFILGRNVEAAGSWTLGAEQTCGLLSPTGTILTAPIAGHYLASSWNGVGGSQVCGKHIDATRMGLPNGQAGATGTFGATTLTSSAATAAIGRNFNAPACFPYPNGPDGGLYLSPVWLHHDNSVRGYLKGFWAPQHDRPFNHNDTISGSGNLSGKSFVVQNVFCIGPSNANDYGQILIETSNTWS